MANEYSTNTLLKARLGISGSTYDTLLTTLLEAASRAIDDDCGREFFTTAGAARYFDGDGSDLLILPDKNDLQSVTSVLEYDADGVLAETWTEGVDGYYVLLPHNASPKWALKAVQGYAFTQGVKNFKITGNWGYAASVPPQIAQACLNRAITLWNRLRAGEIPYESVRNGEVAKKYASPKTERERLLMGVAAFKRVVFTA